MLTAMGCSWPVKHQHGSDAGHLAYNSWSVYIQGSVAHSVAYSACLFT